MKEKTEQPWRILQISDSHLFAKPDGQLMGLVTQDSLKAVIELAQTNHCDPDLILATGDISQDGTKRSYQRFFDCVQVFGKPVCWLSGNHDHLGHMQSVVGVEGCINPCYVDFGSWRLIALDTLVPGLTSGRLRDEQLDFLSACLADPKCPEHVMVCLHHHPVLLSTQWLDAIALENPQALFDILDKNTSVRALVWGHVHQAYEGQRSGVSLFGTPSTCVQFKPKASDFAADTLTPGYRYFELYPAGRIQTYVGRLPQGSFMPDFSIDGY